MEYTYVPSNTESIPDDKVSELYNQPLVSGAYVIDSPNRHQDSYVIHTQLMLADVGDSCRIDTSANVS